MFLLFRIFFNLMLLIPNQTCLARWSSISNTQISLRKSLQSIQLDIRLDGLGSLGKRSLTSFGVPVCLQSRALLPLE